MEKRGERLKKQQRREDLRTLVIVIVILIVVCSLGSWLFQQHDHRNNETKNDQQATSKVTHHSKLHKQHKTNQKVNAIWLNLKQKQKLALIIQAYNYDEQNVLNVNDFYWALKGNLDEGTIYHNGSNDGFNFKIKQNHLIITDNLNHHFTHSLTWLIKRYYQSSDKQQFSNKLANRIISLTALHNYVEQQNMLAAQQASIAAANAAAQRAAAASAAAASSSSSTNSSNYQPINNSNNQHYTTNNSYVNYQSTGGWHSQQQ